MQNKPVFLHPLLKKTRPILVALRTNHAEKLSSRSVLFPRTKLSSLETIHGQRKAINSRRDNTCWYQCLILHVKFIRKMAKTGKLQEMCEYTCANLRYATMKSFEKHHYIIIILHHHTTDSRRRRRRPQPTLLILLRYINTLNLL